MEMSVLGEGQGPEVPTLPPDSPPNPHVGADERGTVGPAFIGKLTPFLLSFIV
jgi:hypothetical protein